MEGEGEEEEAKPAAMERSPKSFFFEKLGGLLMESGAEFARRNYTVACIPFNCSSRNG